MLKQCSTIRYNITIWPTKVHLYHKTFSVKFKMVNCSILIFVCCTLVLSHLLGQKLLWFASITLEVWGFWIEIREVTSGVCC